MPQRFYRARMSIGLAALLALTIAPLQALAGPDFLVDAEWLADRLDDENTVILEVRYHPHRFFTVGHIPGAV